jgi:hypothetical protein
MKHALIALCLAIGLATTAHAGRSCQEEGPPKADTVERGLRLAERTYRALEASGERVVILARAGQDLSQYRLRYSHLGFAYQAPDGKGGTVWRVLHKLNQCGTTIASIYRQGLGEFFLDDLWRLEAAWVVPTPEVQDRLLKLLLDDDRAIRFHHKPYSIVSYAWGQQYQQSNQWAIETLAAAMDPSVTSRDTAQAWLRLKGYVPTTLVLGPLTRLGARMTAANVSFDDHPSARRFSDQIDTVTVDSVFAWMQRAGLGGAPVVIRQP